MVFGGCGGNHFVEFMPRGARAMVRRARNLAIGERRYSHRYGREGRAAMATHFDGSASRGWNGDFAGSRSKLIDAWGHHAPDVLSVAIVTIVAVRFFPPPRMLVLPLAAALAFAVISSWLLMRRHDHRLCEPCVAALPLNPAGQAERFRYRFRVAHIGSNPPAVVAYLSVVIGSNFLPGVAGRAIWAVAQLSLIFLVRSHVTHRRLQPWCPVCRRDGGGDEVIHEPDLPRPSDRQPV
jgi:hypothetical protein